jgi:hypothetical protein
MFHVLSMQWEVNAKTQRRSADTAATKQKLLAENSSGRMMLNHGFHG